MFGMRLRMPGREALRLGISNSLIEKLNVVIGDSIAKPRSRTSARASHPCATAGARKQLLDTKAQVNIAEGNKDRSNETETQPLMEISDLAQQVEELAKALSKKPDAVDPEARLIALEKLVEMRRLEQLQSIGSSQSNSTYFFGDRSALGQNRYSIDYAEQVKSGMHKNNSSIATGSAATASI
ncbi:hypothetical protein FIBSPDRAFT_871146 [Athelia psychrophila]|uniref:Uncharacterized protein n=1 Tax=Athelia psychrophila TaxID=1759441 RepID=A0A166AGX2_9AGAM|nr:hypothetical protein FIBSPDRAFT_871146 [Fibularhizoctonia sp. CBS 109695]